MLTATRGDMLAIAIEMQRAHEAEMAPIYAQWRAAMAPYNELPPLPNADVTPDDEQAPE